MINILFVCMGNICRSPSAEGFFSNALQSSKYGEQIVTDSAGTHSYHVGHSPDSRAIEAAGDFGVDISRLRARKVGVADFDAFDMIIAMDHDNFEDLQSIRPKGSKAILKLMMQYHPDGQPEEVPDPYYGGQSGFTYMCKLLESATRGLLRDVEERLAQK